MVLLFGAVFIENRSKGFVEGQVHDRVGYDQDAVDRDVAGFMPAMPVMLEIHR